MTATRLHIICERDVGLFSLGQQAIANNAWALHEKRIPIICFGQRACYWTPNGYRGRDTIWEYYFEPAVPGYSVSCIPAHIRETIAARPPSDREFGYFADESTFVSNNFGRHPGFGDKSLAIPYEFDDPDNSLRNRASAIIHTYVRPRPEITERADRFFSTHLRGRYVIGVQLRGTDALMEAKRIRLGHYLDFSRYIARINELLRVQSDAAIFVASDAESSVVKMREIFGDRIVATDAFRHQSGDFAGRGPTGEVMPAYLTGDADNAARGGEDAVVDYLLLSRCNCLVHNGSSLARTVMLNVPEMPVLSTVAEPSHLNRIAYRWWLWSQRWFLPLSRRLKAAPSAKSRRREVLG
jgi:hypothetical protein